MEREYYMEEEEWDINWESFVGGVKKLLIGFGVMLLISGALSINDSYMISSGQINGGYVVVSVYKGAVYVENKRTGRIKPVYDDNLVRKALNGKIKKGDIILLR